MLGAQEIIKEAESLSIEERTIVVDGLLRSLNPPDPDIDRKWAAVAKRRLEDLRSGRVEPVSGEAVFDNIRKRFSS